MTIAGSTESAGVYQSKAPKLGLIGGFDGIRGIGVCMVLVGHALFEYVESWVTIVDSFFVLSGFLITTLLLQEARTTGSISLKKFYTRRAIRLFPSLWLFVGVWLVISTIATLVGFEALSLRYVGQDAAAALLYVYHLFFPNGLYVIEPAVQEHRTMWHLWTLSIEEWFYAVIAGTVLICVRRRWIAQLGALMVAAVLAIGVARWFAFTGFYQDDQDMVAGVRMALLQRPDALMLGVAIACANSYLTKERMERVRRPVLVAASVGLVVWFVMLNLSSGLVEKLGGPYVDYLPTGPEEFTRPQMLDTMYWFRFGHTLGAIGFGLILVGLVHYSDWWLNRLWSWHRFQWLGRLSYTLYVWHAMPYIILMAVLGGADAPPAVQLARTPILIAAAFAVSMPVYYLVELRVLRMKLRFASEKEVLDLRTGKMVQVDHADQIASADRTLSPDEIGDTPAAGDDAEPPGGGADPQRPGSEPPRP
ncbi:MAG: acyltransferase family protein [Microthrixaceae bacterium]